MPSYHRVASNESSASEHDVADNNNNNNSIHSQTTTTTTTTRIQRRTLAERFSDKLFAAAWVSVAAAVAYWANVWHVLTAPADSPANHALLQLAAICVGINTVLFLYLIVYLPYIKGLTDSSAWDVYCPRVIPTATAVGVLCSLLLIRATWPVWGFLAPLVLGIEGLGVLFSLHFVPWPF